MNLSGLKSYSRTHYVIRGFARDTDCFMGNTRKAHHPHYVTRDFVKTFTIVSIQLKL